MKEKQNIFQRIKLYIIKPSVFFEKYKENPKYLFHLIILIIISIAAGLISNYTMMAGIDMSGADMSGAVAMGSLFTVVRVAVMSLIVYYVTSLIYYIIVGKILKGEGKFKQMMVVVLLASYPTQIQGLIRSFLPVNLQPNLMQTITRYFNVITLWQIFLLIIGTSVVFNMSKKKSSMIHIILSIIGLLSVIGYSMYSTAALQY